MIVGILVTSVLVGTIVGIIAYRKGWRPSLPKRSAARASARISSTSGNAWKSVASIVRSVAVVTFVLLIFWGIKQVYNWSSQREFRAIVRQAQTDQAQEALAQSLRSAIVLPSRDTIFVVVAPKKGSPIFIPPWGYCIRSEAVNRAHSFVTITQSGRYVELPNTDPNLGNVRFFSLAAYGGPTTEVRIKISKLAHDECKPRRS